MSQPPLRFVHASDLRLDRPLGGVTEVPPELREAFLEAPYLAAEQVFETALAENADAVLLSGNIVDLYQAGPRAAAFLAKHFQRLADNGIEVFWAGGQVDPPDAWPASVRLPESVHRFGVGRVESFAITRGEKPIARIQGISRSPGQGLDDSGFHRDANGLFTIGVAFGTAASPGAEGDRVHYMALGGQHRRQTVDQSPGIAHYAGTPQGRSPAEPEAHGCTVVSVDETGHVKTLFVATDVVRWVTETVEATAGCDEAALLRLIEQKADKLREKHVGRDLLVTWRITGRGELLNYLRPDGYGAELLTRLRKKWAKESPALWSVSLECREPLQAPGEWYDEETIRGDLLRQFREFENDATAALELESFLPEDRPTGVYAELAEIPSHQRAELLLAASKLGMELIAVDDED
ncbi:MAG: hypothetical protein KDA44_00340 [Planctomycetales bacterium]|nr:hypothetical protein [Planctomycetales bacterium]